MKIRVKFTHVDSYTWEFIEEDKIINISSEKAAVKWVKQNYFNVWIVHTAVIPE